MDLVKKGLGKARRINEAFQIMESIEKGTAAGNPKLSSSLVYGLLDALINAGKDSFKFSHMLNKDCCCWFVVV